MQNIRLTSSPKPRYWLHSLYRSILNTVSIRDLLASVRPPCSPAFWYPKSCRLQLGMKLKPAGLSGDQEHSLDDQSKQGGFRASRARLNESISTSKSNLSTSAAVQPSCRGQMFDADSCSAAGVPETAELARMTQKIGFILTRSSCKVSQVA
jgi:hypothetical protein